MITRRQAKLQETGYATKRKAAESPVDKNVRKRSAFGDLTNALRNVQIGSSKKIADKIADAAKRHLKAGCQENVRFTKLRSIPIIEGPKFLNKTSIANLDKLKSGSDSRNASRPLKVELVDSRSFSATILEEPNGSTAYEVVKEQGQQISISLPCSQHYDETIEECKECSTNGSSTSGINTVLTSTIVGAEKRQLNPRRRSSKTSAKTNTNTYLKVRTAHSDALEETTAVQESPCKKLRRRESSPEIPTEYDKQYAYDIFQVPQYAQHIFDYYRSREKRFVVGDYITRQTNITKHMRAILVDWMVEIQENFELNHETLYQAVKISDLYLDRRIVDKKMLQLVGTTALFISSKFDERMPPCVEDFLYICDDAYSRKQLLDMERDVLRELRFEISFPLSYRFLRRYCKVSQTSIETMTLARYILEMSLINYEHVFILESVIAAASLLLAIRMKNEGDWSETHRQYSGYTIDEIEPLMWRLNKFLIVSKVDHYFKGLTNIKDKYSHEIFHKVALVPLLVEKH